ncbi:ABC transporter ATP-binding protein [Micromonospora phytophila]|uniref:ABC transporter ATP-binding protein n=1 Tax=Micromonospora phytophila TaxID=709888 RepID=UPI00202E40C8|nr:ABC transporter ATP-binding protein [Micromonospora phytophila]MCM0676311.1 ABC transporter ATP-binding protein [Micromonospora phytophila]
MSEVVLTGVVKRYGSVTALAGVDLTVPAGLLTAVLGPSGCGKTTLLRCLAGFERLDAGEIRIDGAPVAGNGRHLPTHRRRIAVVPQEGALFPHLNVAANVGYGLDRAARRGDRVEEVLTLVGLAGYGGRMPHQLSGGQQQRVAVARALAPRPSVVLLDEPFSALDAGLRAGLRHDVREALRADGATGVLVTHDQGEALSVADRVVVLRAGRVVQCAAPTTVYRGPADEWVAVFVGDAELLPAVAERGAARTALGTVPIAGAAPDGPVTVLVRPEQVRLSPGPGAVTATVLRHDFHGHDALVGLRLADGTRITARILDDATAVPVGAAVSVSVDGAGRAFPAAGAATPTERAGQSVAA